MQIHTKHRRRDNSTININIIIITNYYYYYYYYYYYIIIIYYTQRRVRFEKKILYSSRASSVRLYCVYNYVGL